MRTRPQKSNQQQHLPIDALTPDTRWTTVYTERALEAVRAEGKRPSATDISRLSPLGFAHYNMLGRYNFQLPDIVRTGKFRPLRTAGSPW